jgi:Zn finger protein HypA/HybF involved in hydrogenase expression
MSHTTQNILGVVGRLLLVGVAVEVVRIRLRRNKSTLKCLSCGAKKKKKKKKKNDASLREVCPCRNGEVHLFGVHEFKS